MNYTENVIVPERTLLVSLDTGEYELKMPLIRRCKVPNY